MINNLMQVAGFIIDNADSYDNDDKGKYYHYILYSGKFKMELYIVLDQYTLWIDETEVTFKDKIVNPGDYARFMSKYWELTR